ncbi:glycosyl hydrolase family protein, partial [Pseudomonas amygdali pv. mori str. 301020]
KKGIDLSHFQGDIDFKKVFEAGIEYAFIKSTEGATVQDNKYHVSYVTLESLELKRGHIITFVRSAARRKHNEIT